ncbi:MAG: hypothetical protein JRG92_05425 [Deltaproteobacteria bacterium]|nr:hypothetical protein [Deltaproteobacteria bacterium]
MGRTRLRGIEIAGIVLAVESPPGFQWNWPEQGLGELACAPSEPEIHIGVTVGEVVPPQGSPITYSFDGGTFDVDRVGGEWIVAVHGTRQPFERLARFDADFTVGHVVVSPGAVQACAHPLVGPLLDLILIHRLIALGGLVLEGTAVIENGRALALIAGDAGAEQPADVPKSWRRIAAPGQSFTPGSRFALRIEDSRVRVHGLPGRRGAAATALSGRLEAIHLIARSSQMFADTVSGDDAADILLEHVYAPVHDPDCTERLMTAAARVASRVPVMRLGMPEEQRVVPFAWGKRRAALGFAPPPVG